MRQNRNDDLRSRQVLPSVNDPNVLVLQGVKKAARGNYSCKVGNGIPTYNYEVESKPVFLDVKCKYTYNLLRNLVDVSNWVFRYLNNRIHLHIISVITYDATIEYF